MAACERLWGDPSVRYSLCIAGTLNLQETTISNSYILLICPLSDNSPPLPRTTRMVYRDVHLLWSVSHLKDSLSLYCNPTVTVEENVILLIKHSHCITHTITVNNRNVESVPNTHAMFKSSLMYCGMNNPQNEWWTCVRVCVCVCVRVCVCVCVLR